MYRQHSPAITGSEPFASATSHARVVLERVAPKWLFRFLRSAFYRVWRYPRARLLSFDQLFRSATKLDPIAARAVPTPEVKSMALLDRAEYLRGDRYLIPEDYTAILPEALYCPTNNVVLTPSKEVVAESLNTGTLQNLDMRALYTRRVEPLPGYAAPLRSRYNNYYHSLIDNFPRLLSLRHPSLAALPEIQLLCPGGLTHVEAFFLPRFCPPNVRVVVPEEGRLYDVEHLIFTPFKTRRFAGYVPPEYVAFVRENLLPERPRTRSNRILVSREKAKMRKVENHLELIWALEKRGFREVVLEELPLEQQVELFYDAEVVVGGHGSGLVNILFSEEIHVLEMFPANFVVPHYYYLSKSLGHKYSFCCGEQEIRDARTFQVDVPAVLARLDGAGIR